MRIYLREMSFLHGEIAPGQPEILNPAFSGRGFIGLRDESQSLQPAPWMENMAGPVNNFLKDPSEMEKEFRREVDTDAVEFRPYSRGKIIPIDEALKGCMEQNY